MVTASPESLAELGKQFERTHKLKAQGYNLERLAQRVASVFQMPPETITSPGRYRRAVKARSVFLLSGAWGKYNRLCEEFEAIAARREYLSQEG